MEISDAIVEPAADSRDEGNFEDVEYLTEEYIDEDFSCDDEDESDLDEIETLGCTLCPQKVARHALQRHMESNHAEYECSTCKKKYFSQCMLRKHLRCAHLEGMRLQCPLCPIILRTKYNLQQHIFTHAKVAQFKCPYEHCNKSFKHVNTLKQHEKIHEQRNRRECPICHEKVTRLQSHVLTHSSERPYPCDMCDRSYISKQQLKVHQTSHLDDGYLCDICHGRFKSEATLYKHRKSVHSDCSFPCPECGKEYKRRDNMVSHAKKVHADCQFVQEMLGKRR